MHRFAHQTDLFSTQQDIFDDRAQPGEGSLADQLDEHPGQEFIQRIREQLNATLALARDSSGFPWPDLTRTYVEEIRVNSMSRWLPRAEASALRKAFAAEMDRIYAAEDEMRPDVPGAEY